MTGPQFLQFSINVTMFVLGITALGIVTLVWPPLLRFAIIRNGLGLLRKLMYGKSFLLLAIILIIEFLLGARRLMGAGETAYYIWGSLIMVMAGGFFFKMVFDAIIVHTQYTPEHIEKAARIQALINKEDIRDGRRNTARLKLNQDRRDATVARNSRKD